MNDGKDRRVAKRINYVCEVQCDGVSRLVTRINDLSVTGAFIDSLQCYPAGTILALRFHIKDVLIETSAEVRYGMQTMGMGLHFLDLQPDHLAALESLIEGKPMAEPDSQTANINQTNPEASKIPDVLLGNFAVVSMFDVIQIIENNRLVGTLAVKTPGEKGEIHFDDGQIVDAHSDSRAGTDALRNFLGVNEGSFEFTRTTERYPNTLGATNNMSLIMDLLRERDEEASSLK